MKQIQIVVLLTTLSSACLFTPPASAGVFRKWEKSEINQVKDRTEGLKQRTQQIRQDAQEMADDFRERKSEVAGDLRDQIEAAREIFKNRIEDELSGDFDSFKSNDCQPFYDDIEDFMEKLMMLDDALLDFAFEPDWLGDKELGFFTPDVGFELPNDASDSTCRMLYPMWKVLDAAAEIEKAIEFVTCVSEDVVQIVELAKKDVVCEEMMEGRSEIRDLTRRLTKGSIALDNFGGSLEKRSKGKDVNVAIWGWAGFTIKIETLKKIGMRSKSSAEGLTKLTDYVNDKLESCEREAILMSMSPPMEP